MVNAVRFFFIFLFLFRVNPTPREFRAHLRDSMVESVMANTVGKNCKDDLDEHLFSLDSLVSAGSLKAIKSRLERDIPAPLQGIMSGAAPSLPVPSSLHIMDQGVLGFIGGYIVKKLVDRQILCEMCVHLLRADNFEHPAHAWIAARQYPNVHVGLTAPSPYFLGVLTTMETSFRARAAGALHTDQIMDSFIRHVLQDSLDCSNCEVKFSVAALFVNVRFNHLLKTLHADWREEKSRKRSTRRKRATFNHS